MSTSNPSETQIAIGEIDTEAVKVDVRRQRVSDRLKNILTIDTEGAGVLHAHQAQRAENLAHGSLAEDVPVTAAMQERADAISQAKEHYDQS